MTYAIRRLRLIEWLCAFIILTTGLHLLAFPATFYRPAMSGLNGMASYGLWTMLLVASGIARIGALWINGHWPGGTPQVRLLGSLMGVGIFGAFAGAFLDISSFGAPSIAISTYGILMIADMVNCGFATSDIFNARRDQI